MVDEWCSVAHIQRKGNCQNTLYLILDLFILYNFHFNINQNSFEHFDEWYKYIIECFSILI